MSVGLETRSITEVLNRLSKIALPARLEARIRDWTSSYGKIRLVLKHNRYFLESSVPEFLRILLNDEVIGPCRVVRENEMGQEVFGMERGVAARRDYHIPGTEEARRAAEGVMEPVQDRSGVRDDVIGAVIGIDQSEWRILRFLAVLGLEIETNDRRRDGRGRRSTLVRSSHREDGGSA